MAADDKALGDDLELRKFQLDRSRYRTDLLKWVVVAIGAIVSFGVIDYGNLRLEQFRVTAENQRQLMEAYLTATESPEPDVWKRKLQVLIRVADDERIRKWADDELTYIEQFAARDALYRETLKVASQLIEPSRLNEAERTTARVRFDQLYWADLPYVRESPAVERAMVDFRNQLLLAEAAPGDKKLWQDLSRSLISLSRTLRNETPPDPRRTTPVNPPG
jgi:hypothetical protein